MASGQRSKGVSTHDNAARDRRDSEALHATLTPQELRQEVASGLILDILQERRSERRWKRVRRIGTAALVGVGLLVYVASYAGILGYRALPVSDTVAVVPIPPLTAESSPLVLLHLPPPTLE